MLAQWANGTGEAEGEEQREDDHSEELKKQKQRRVKKEHIFL